MKYWIILFFVAIAAGCNESSDMNRDDFECLDNTEFRKLIKETKKIAIEDIDTLEVKVIMGAGRLLISGKTKHLFAGSFAYNHEDFAPRVKYQKENTGGKIKIIPKQFKENSEHEDIKNVWNLRFNEEIPMIMDLKFGAGLGEINLGSLNLYAGVLKLGAGKIDINLNESKSIKDLIIKMGVGDVTINLTDFERNSCNIKVDGGIGKFTLILPDDKNSDIYIDRGIAKVSADKFSKSSDHYFNHVNDNHETLNVIINAGLGHIELKNSSEVNITAETEKEDFDETEL